MLPKMLVKLPVKQLALPVCANDGPRNLRKSLLHVCVHVRRVALRMWDVAHRNPFWDLFFAGKNSP